MADARDPTGVRAAIRRYVDRGIAGDIRDEDDMFALGLVDSLFAIQLVVFVEDEFSITVERDELDIKHFSSIDALTSFVLGKLGATRGEPTHDRPAD